MAHLEAWDVRRTLTRIFGFGGWGDETLELTCTHEIQIPPTNPKGRPRWTVIYRAQVRLNVRTPDGRPLASFDDAASGDSQNQPSLADAHDMAMKTALSQALKRCAVNLGDQLGLSLYRKGDVNAVVGWSVPHMPEQETAPEDPGPGATEPESEEQGPDAAQVEASVKWAKQATSRLPGADLAAVAAVESEAAKRFRAGTLPPDAAQTLRDAINARRAELGGADAAA